MAYHDRSLGINKVALDKKHGLDVTRQYIAANLFMPPYHKRIILTRDQFGPTFIARRN